jgi:thiamine kinase-like enzyme
MPMLSQINAAEEAEVRDALARIAVLARSPSPWRVTRLASLTNRSFLVERGNGASAEPAVAEGEAPQGEAPQDEAPQDEAYVLRLPGKGTEQYIDRAGEAVNVRAAAGIGLAPPILYADPTSGVMLSRYIAGAVPLSPDRLREADHFRAAVGLLQRLHGSGLVFSGEMRLYPKLDQYLAMASTSALRELRRAGEALRTVIEPGWGPLRPCHIDPAPHNFIAAAGRHFLLDWEYAAMCDPVWDLAGLSIEARFDLAQDRAMLAQYFGATAQLEAWGSRLHLYRIMLRLVAASWGAVQIAQGNGSWTAAELVDPLVALTAADLGDPALGRHLAAAA